jgi:putative tryptophan/tyrosine transport system substrate-binding protein
MRRREFIAGLGGTVASALAARAQQAALPVVAFVSAGSADGLSGSVTAFNKGLGDTGYTDGQNVTIGYHWLENRYDRMPALAANLVRRRVAVIFAMGSVALDAKAATSTIPILFDLGEDPVQLGMVASLARPNGNATGTNNFAREAVGKRLGLLHQLVPEAVRIAVLVNPAQASVTEATLREVRQAASARGFQLQVANATTIGDIDDAFAAFARQRPHALFIGPDGFFVSHRAQLTALAARVRIPTSYSVREYVTAGGLMSYSVDFAETYRQLGNYAGRILNGDKPADLPVLQSTKFEFAINLKTAKALGLTIPPNLLALADEVIE